MALIADLSSEDGTKGWAQLQQAPPKEFSRSKESSPVIPNSGEAGQRVQVEAGVPGITLPANYPGTHRIRFEYVEGDAQVPAAAGERAELQRFNATLVSGDEIWADGWFMVEKQDSSHYALIRQWHEDSSTGSAPGVAVGLYVEGNTCFLEPNTGKAWWTGPIVNNQWYHYKLRIKVSATEGLVELWFSDDKSALVKQSVKSGAGYNNTLNPKTPGVGDQIYDKMGFNRSQAAVGTTTIYHAGEALYSSDPGERAGSTRRFSVVPAKETDLAIKPQATIIGLPSLLGIGTFEGGTESWINVGSSIAQSTEHPHGGGESVEEGANLLEPGTFDGGTESWFGVSAAVALNAEHLHTGSTPEEEGANVLEPGTFEGGAESWFGVGAAAAQSAEHAHGGSKSLKVTPEGTGGFNGAGKESGTALVGGRTYRLKVWVYRESGKTVRLLASSTGASGEEISQDFVAGATGYAQYTLEFTAKDSAKYVFYVRCGETSTSPYWIDDLTLKILSVGAHSLKVTPAGTGAFNGAARETPTPLTAGRTYRFSVWVYRESGKTVRLFAGSQGTSGQEVSADATAEATGWALYSFEFVPDESAPYTLQVRCGEAASTSPYWLDDLKLRVMSAGGTHSLKVTPAGSGAFNGAGKETIDDLEEGATYRVQAWVYRESGKTVRFQLEGPGEVDTQTHDFIASATGYHLYVLEFTAGDSGKYFFSIRCGEGASTSPYWIDDASMVLLKAAEPEPEPPPEEEPEPPAPATPIRRGVGHRAIPKLKVPLQMGAHSLALVEQDSLDNVAACVYAISAYELGSRLEDPDFGIEDNTFETYPLDLGEWAEQIARYEPRAAAASSQELTELVDRVTVEVET